jgi:hypothetical protein
MKPAEIAREIGGDNLIRYFDLIQAEQRKRWSTPGWRTQSITEADIQNWRDVTAALTTLIKELQP